MRRLLPLLCLFACNEHPLSPIETSVSGGRTQTDVQPPKTKFDFLFVVDNSGSMCQEQENLAANFQAIADFLYETLGAAADYRIAVTSTDMVDDRGAFLARPTEPRPAIQCRQDDGSGWVPETSDCFDGELEPVLSSEDGLAQAEFVRRFRCLATLGTNGNNQEKGLEAMRMALSCSGPNAALFGECCVDGRYNPACKPATEPGFLRPDANLVVVVVSDEDDCSDPIENPAMSSRAICKYGPVDADLDAVPDGYRDAGLCDGLTPAACFWRDCGEEDADACHARCRVVTEQDACEWNRADLVPPTEYVTFLNSLKPDPLRQVVFASIVGSQARTELGAAITYNPGQASPECEAEDSVSPSEACCPDGRCEGSKRPSCFSENGEAFVGRRYLTVAGAFGTNGIGCRPEDEGTERCVSICADDFATPLKQVEDRLVELAGLHCLESAPECVVFEDELMRPCAGGELDDAKNYSLLVDVDCDPLNRNAACDVLEDPVASRGAWTLKLEEERCGGRPAVQLSKIPPVGAEVRIDYVVDLDR